MRTARWHKLTRYYVAERCADLFGTPCVRIVFGSLTTRYARQLTRPFDNEADADAAFDAVAKRRLQRGYVEIHA